MKKIITISLAGNAYQLEEDAHIMLQDYLAAAAKSLAGDPGNEEILSDLERAFGEKCDRVISPGKNVVSGTETERFVNEMGPVQSSSSEDARPEDAAKSAPQAERRRLYRLKEEGYLFGVCAGLAAYLGVDATVIRILFALLTLFSNGSGILVYVLLVFLVPKARTDKEKATAAGEPFTAREWADSVRETSGSRSEARSWRSLRREMRRYIKEETRRQGGLLDTDRRLGRLPIAAFGAALSLIWFIGILGLVSGGRVLGWPIPDGTPLWAALLGWSYLYVLILQPMKLLHGSGSCEGASAGCSRYFLSLANSVFRITLWTALIWAAWHYLPGVQVFLGKLAALFELAIGALTAR